MGRAHSCAMLNWVDAMSPDQACSLAAILASNQADVCDDLGRIGPGFAIREFKPGRKIDLGHFPVRLANQANASEPGYGLFVVTSLGPGARSTDYVARRKLDLSL